MQDIKKQIGLLAANTARSRLMGALEMHGLSEADIAVAVKGALQAKRQVEVLTPKGWDVSPGVPDHKTRMKAADFLADVLDAKAPQRLDITGRGILGTAVVALIEDVLTEQGIVIDVAPVGQLTYRTALLVPSSFSQADSFL